MRNIKWIDTAKLVILLLLIFFAFFYGLGSYALDNTNEGLYAEIAREMLVLHQYTIPHLNFVPYLEKPPLLYWLTALCYQLFGISELSARLVPALSATAVCLTMLWWGKLVQDKTRGWVAALILVSSLGFMVIARVILFDMLLTAWITLGLLFFYAWFLKKQRYYLWLFYAALGAAFLTKGLMPLVLVFSIILIFLLLERQFKTFFSLMDWVGIAIFLAITLPWLLLASIKQAHFFWDYFVNEQILRFFNQRYPADYHTGPLYYYLPRLCVYIFPWILLLPLFFKRTECKIPEKRALNRLMWLWFLVPLVFFSLAGEKGDYYLILSTPALAWLLADKVTVILIQSNKYHAAHWFVLIALIEFLLLLALYLTSYATLDLGLHKLDIGLPEALENTLTILLYCLAAYLIMGALVSYYNKSRQQVSVVLIAGLIIPLVFLYNAIHIVYQDAHSQKATAIYIQDSRGKRVVPVFAFKDYETLSTLPFYLQERLTLIDSASNDLWFGSKTPAAQGWFIDSHAFKQIAKSQPVYVVVRDYRLPDFYAATSPVKFCEVFHNGKFFLLTNLITHCRAVS